MQQSDAAWGHRRLGEMQRLQLSKYTKHDENANTLANVYVGADRHARRWTDHATSALIVREELGCE